MNWKNGALFLLLSVGTIALFTASPVHTPKATALDTQRKAEAYATAQLLDPIYAFPGTDIPSFTRALEAFKLSAEVALPRFPEDAEARNVLYPFRFLSALPGTEEARRLLIEAPSIRHAEDYHQKLLVLLAAHERDLIHADALLAKDRNGNVYHYLSGDNTIDSVRSTLALAREANAEAVKKENRRFDCLKGKKTSCEAGALLRLHFGKTYTPAFDAAVLKSIHTNKETLSGIYPSIKTAPIYALTASACFDEKPAYFSIAIEKSRLSETPAGFAVYLNQLYVENTASSTHPFYAALRKGGASLTYQPFNAYLCPDFGADVGSLFGMNNLLNALTAKPTQPPGFTSGSIKDLKRMGTLFSKGSILQENTYRAYITAATHAVRTTDRALLSHALGGEEESLRVIEQVTEARAKSSQLNLVLGYFDDLQVGSFIPYRLNPIPPSVFLLTRGGLSQLYALSNETVLPGTPSLTRTRMTTADSFKNSEIPLIPLSKKVLETARVGSAKELLTLDAYAKEKIFEPHMTELHTLRVQALYR